ncbi:MAG: ABC transporter ATP-binding protein [Clostridia bacterium]|nr:ABC transporter ATP-binding protein [Clostridia bacterium]
MKTAVPASQAGTAFSLFWTHHHLNAGRGISLDNPTIAVSLRNISKRFGATLANDRVNLDIRRGEILALLGENGSGKTTLMNMISGIYFPDEGEILLNGNPTVIRSPKDAIDLGIGMIHQHFKLVDVLTAAENIELGLEGKLNLKQASQKIREICDMYGFDIDPAQKIYDMSVSQKQTVEIVKVLYRGADILILDEPTAVLTPQETDKLFAVLRNMRDAGKAIVIITHKMHEVEAISDRVAILRKGQYIGEKMTRDTNAQEMTNMMVGHTVSLNIERPEPVAPRPRIEVKDLTVLDEEGIVKLDHVSFTAYSGEVLGVAGISGCGQKELLEAIAGLQVTEAGSSISYVTDDGQKEELIGKDPLEIQSMGVALSFVPEDRLGMGLVGSMDINDNMMLRSFRTGHTVFTDRKAPHEVAEKVVDELDVKTPSLTTPVSRLSGGNVQKVLVGREITTAPSVLLTAYAVRGLDINSSYTIYNLINEQKKQGVAVIYVGEDLDVLLELADRILVLCGGKVSGIIPGRNAIKSQVGMMMTHIGGNLDGEKEA